MDIDTFSCLVRTDDSQGSAVTCQWDIQRTNNTNAKCIESQKERLFPTEDASSNINQTDKREIDRKFQEIIIKHNKPSLSINLGPHRKKVVTTFKTKPLKKRKGRNTKERPSAGNISRPSCERCAETAENQPSITSCSLYPNIVHYFHPVFAARPNLPYYDNLVAPRSDAVTFSPLKTSTLVDFPNYGSPAKTEFNKNFNHRSSRYSNPKNQPKVNIISQQVHLQPLLPDKDTHRVLQAIQIKSEDKEKLNQQGAKKLPIDSPNFDKMLKKINIAIIGAGASGIAAASRLLQGGINDFVVLEANDRIGGRINTVDFGDNVVDLGAQWVHGEVGNVVCELGSKHNLFGSFGTFFDPSKHEFFTINGERIPKKESIEALKIYHHIMEQASHELSKTQGSFGVYFKEKFYKIYSKKCSANPNRSSQFFSWMEKAECSIECSDTLFEVSSKRLADYWECEGDSVLNWKDRGYKTLFDLLMKKIPNAENSLPVMEKVEFKKIVTTIDYSSEENVLITTSDGSKYVASHVIFTASLGVLKKKHSTLFVPPLPPIKQRAIKGLCIGTANKIFMEFSNRWWPEDIVAIDLICLEENKALFVKKYGEKYQCLCDVFSFYAVAYQPRVLCAWIVGKNARQMETLSDSDASNGLYWLLQESVGKYYDVLRPTRILRSKWFTDEHFQGSYSYQSMDSEELNVKPSDLAQPILVIGKPVILFAGEATHDHYFSTVHGAVETGFREADRLLDYNRRTRDCLDHLVYHINNMSIDETGTIEQLNKQLNKQADEQSDKQSDQSDEQPEYDERTQVVIVGAGIAGMAAAATLQSAGWDFIVLEAQDRIGGRIHSVEVEKGWIELGAQYLHGDQSKLAEYCRDNDLLSHFFGTDGEGLYLRDNGCSISSGTVMACDVNDAIHDALHSSEQFYKNNETDYYVVGGESVGEYVRKIFDKYLSECNDPPPIRKMKEEIFDFKMRYLQVDNSCDSMYDLSVKMWGKYEIAGKDKYQMFKEGYVSLLNSLDKDIASDKLRLNCPVETIHWRDSIRSKDNSAVLVTTRDNKRILCNAVIVTCSLGVLKNCHEQMFVPQLPYHMKSAIKNLGFGVVNKIILRYHQPWWHSLVSGFQFLPNHDRPDMPPLPKWTAYITGFDVLPNHTCILVGWISGDGARAIEKVPEMTIGLHVTSLLSRYMNRAIPPPAECYKSRWFANEYIRGGYCNIPICCEDTGVTTSTLAEPIWAKIKSHPSNEIPVVLLAGEATHDRYFSTVHGAYETGVHQAKLCLVHHKILM